MEPRQPQKPPPPQSLPPAAPLPPPSSEWNSKEEQCRVLYFIQHHQFLFSDPSSSRQARILALYQYLFGNGVGATKDVLRGRFLLLGQCFLPQRRDLLQLASDLLLPYDIYGYTESASSGTALSSLQSAHTAAAASRPASAGFSGPLSMTEPSPAARVPFAICECGHASFEEAVIELDKLFYPFYHTRLTSRPGPGRWGFTCCVDGCGWRASIKRVDENGRSTFVTAYTHNNSRPHLALTEPLPVHNHPHHGTGHIQEFPMTEHLKTLIVNNVDVASGSLSDRATAIVEFLWSERNTDPFFRSLPIYTDERLSSLFRFSSARMFARRLHRHHNDALAKSKRPAAPGSFGLEDERHLSTVAPKRHSPPTTDDDDGDAKPAALPSKRKSDDEHESPDGESKLAALPVQRKSDDDHESPDGEPKPATLTAKRNPDDDHQSPAGGSANVAGDFCEVVEDRSGGFFRRSRRAKLATKSDSQLYLPLPRNVVPLDLGRPPVNVRDRLPELRCELSTDDGFKYAIECVDGFKDVSPNNTPHTGFVSDNPGLRCQLDLKEGHLWRLRDKPFPPHHRELWQRHVHKYDNERYLNTEIITCCMYLFNGLGGEGRKYHCFGSLLSQYFVPKDNLSDGSHAHLRRLLMAPRTRQEESQTGIMRLPQGCEFKDMHYLFFPFNPGTVHWHVVVADTRKRLLLDFDSLPGRKKERSHVTALRHFLDAEWGASEPGEKWKSVRAPCMPQADQWSCGVHTIVNILILLGGCDPHNASFSADEWRRRIYVWLRDGNVTFA